MKSKKLNNLISNLSKEELASTCEKLAVEFSALATATGYAQSQEEHAISAVERCSMPSTPCVPLRQSLIGLSDNVSINLHCHTEDFMPSLDQLIQLDQLVKAGEVNGTIHSVIEPSLIATWKKD